MPTADAFGHEVYYEQAGDEGPPVVLLHGIPTHSAQWRPVQELLAPYAGTYAMDPIGMGHSDKPLDDWKYSFREDARVVADLMDEGVTTRWW